MINFNIAKMRMHVHVHNNCIHLLMLSLNSEYLPQCRHFNYNNNIQ